jgi:acyl-CoA dehydrogenase
MAVDLSIPTELVQLQESVRAFVTRELRPLEHDVDQADDIDPDVARALRMKAVALGLVGFNIPSAIGGGGVGPLGEVLIGEEVGRTSVPLADAVGRLPQALVFASDEQRPWLLAPALRGETTVCVALSEPDAGSDLMGIQTQARRDGDSWKINGSKVFISNVDTCDYALVLAVTDPSAPLRSRFTTFVVDRNDPGLGITRRFRKMGWRGYHISAFSLDTTVTCDRVLGEVGGGFETIMTAVNSMRLYIASRCVGAAKELLRLAVEYTQNRSTFGKRLGDHQAIQFMLADMDVEIEAARLLVLSTAWKAENKAADVRISASRAKLYASEMAGRAADATVQIFGGAGYMDDYPVERLYRDVRAFRIGEGTSEMQRVQIARHLLNGA